MNSSESRPSNPHNPSPVGPSSPVGTGRVSGSSSDPSSQEPTSLHRDIYQRLGALRRRIRIYVLLHGLLLAFLWLGGLYGLGFLFDYGPVLLAFNEMPVQVRACLLILILAGLVWILYQWVLVRLWTPLSDQSLALLLERRFPELQDAVATIVNHDGSSSTRQDQAPAAAIQQDTSDEKPLIANATLVEQVRKQAYSGLQQVSLGEIFHFGPLVRVGAIAVVLAIGFVWFGIAYPTTLSTSFRRLVLLDSVQWPRVCRLEMVGFKVHHRQPLDDIPEMEQLVAFDEQGTATVGRASSIQLMIRAEAPAAAPAASDSASPFARQLPRTCQLHYWTEDGFQGQLPFEKMGGVRDGFQTFALDGDVLSDLLHPISFYIVGGDHRIGPFQINTVPSPVVTETDLECEFPPYMVDEASMRWTPRTIRWTGLTQLPYGTRVCIRARSNRPLRHIYIANEQNELIETLTSNQSDPSDDFEFTLPRLEENQRLQFILQDVAGVFSQRSHLFTVDVIEDAPPQVETRLLGIGSAITPQARIPLTGTVRDDYGVQRSWIEMETPVSETVVQENQVESSGALSGEVDLLNLQRQTASSLRLPTTPDSQVSLAVLATDYYDLGTTPGQTSVSHRYLLDVVTPDQLLRILERLEVDQRRRLEQIYEEMMEARVYLVQSRSSASSHADSPKAGREPGDSVPASTNQDETSANSSVEPAGLDKLELRKLYVQRALLQTQKSRQEILGVAEVFEDLRLQLINNRLDAQDRQERLAGSVIKPLRHTSQETMDALEITLEAQDENYVSLSELLPQAAQDTSTANTLDDFPKLLATIEQTTEKTIAQVDETLLQLQTILNSLQKFETHNELLDLVRQMIETQEQLLERTKAERNRQSFDDLLK